MADFSDTAPAPSSQNIVAWEEMTNDEEREALINATKTNAAFFEIAVAVANGERVESTEQTVGEDSDPFAHHSGRYRVGGYAFEVILPQFGENDHGMVMPPTISGVFAYADLQIAIHRTDAVGAMVAPVGTLTLNAEQRFGQVGAGMIDKLGFVGGNVDCSLTPDHVIDLLYLLSKRADEAKITISLDSPVSGAPKPKRMVDLLPLLREAYANFEAARAMAGQQ